METRANKIFLGHFDQIVNLPNFALPFKAFLTCPVSQLFGKSGVTHCSFLPYLIVSLDVWREASHLGRGRVTIVSSDDYDFVELVECVYQSREGDTCCFV